MRGEGLPSLEEKESSRNGVTADDADGSYEQIFHFSLIQDTNEQIKNLGTNVIEPKCGSSIGRG
jgi:hypothetical protein